LATTFFTVPGKRLRFPNNVNLWNKIYPVLGSLPAA